MFRKRHPLVVAHQHQHQQQSQWLMKKNSSFDHLPRLVCSITTTIELWEHQASRTQALIYPYFSFVSTKCRHLKSGCLKTLPRDSSLCKNRCRTELSRSVSSSHWAKWSKVLPTFFFTPRRSLFLSPCMNTFYNQTLLKLLVTHFGLYIHLRPWLFFQMVNVALSSRAYAQCLAIHAKLMQTEFDSEGKWLLGFKRLIDLYASS